LLITGVAQERALPAEVTNQILDRTDGVPLFIEELTMTAMVVIGSPLSPLSTTGPFTM
jgi:predicted ATPase